MELHGKAVLFGVVDALAAAVIGIDPGLRSAQPLQAVGHDRIAVVLGGDVGVSRPDLTDRLVAAAVAVSTECLDKFPKSRTEVKFPFQPHRMLRNGQNGKKSNLKVKNTVLKSSYLQCMAFHVTSCRA